MLTYLELKLVPGIDIQLSERECELMVPSHTNNPAAASLCQFTVYSQECRPDFTPGVDCGRQSQKLNYQLKCLLFLHVFKNYFILYISFFSKSLALFPPPPSRPGVPIKFEIYK